MKKIQFLKNHENKKIGWVCEVPDGVAKQLVKDGIAQVVPNTLPSRKDVALYDSGCNPSPKKTKEEKTETAIQQTSNSKE